MDQPSSTVKTASAAALVAFALTAGHVSGRLAAAPPAPLIGTVKVFQNEHIWVAQRTDGGVPIYAARTCSYEFSDAGQRDVCTSDGAPVTEAQAKLFEQFLTARGIPVPR